MLFRSVSQSRYDVGGVAPCKMIQLRVARAGVSQQVSVLADDGGQINRGHLIQVVGHRQRGFDIGSERDGAVCADGIGR